MGPGPWPLRRTLHWVGALCRGARRRRRSASRFAPTSERADRRYRLRAALRAPSVVLWGTTTCVSERQHILTHPAYDLLEVRPWQALRHSLQASQELLFCFATSRCPRHDQADDLRPDGIIERHERWRAGREGHCLDALLPLSPLACSALVTLAIAVLNDEVSAFEPIRAMQGRCQRAFIHL